MNTRMIYCSACDKEVVVIMQAKPDEAEGADVWADVVCTEIGTSCTGTLCPVCAKPPDVIRQELKELNS